MVVPAPPAGGTDLVARLYSDLLSQELGQQVIVDNKGGGNGNVGTAIVARAKPDGYTVLMQYSAYHAANPALIKTLNWSPDDFAGVAMGAVGAACHRDRQEGAGRHSQGLHRLRQGQPGQAQLRLGRPRLGAASRRRAVNKAAGIDLVHVPYKGAGPATADLVAGQVELLIVTPPSVSAHIRSGAVKALALAGETRHPAFPDIPTTAEAGLPGFMLDAWFALFAPAGTPQPIVDRLNAAMRKIAKMDVTRERANQLGTVLKDWTPAEMDKFARSEVAAWGQVIRDNNITMG